MGLMLAGHSTKEKELNQKIGEKFDQRHQANYRSRALFESAPVMYVITRKLGETAVVVDCNQLFLDTLGYRRDEVVERPLAVFQAPGSCTVPAGNYRQISDHEILVEECQLLTREGRIIETILRATPDLDREGNQLGMQAMYLDITDRKQAERMYQGLLEAAPDAMVIVNNKGCIVLVNARTEQVFGYDREALLDQHLEILIPTRFQARHRVHMEGYFSQPAMRPMGQSLELLGRRQDGSEFPVEISLSPLMTHEGLLVSSVIRDVSVQHQVAAELEFQRRELRTLARWLVDAQETERKELARELHDRVGQRLTGLDFNLNLMKSLLTQDPPAIDRILPVLEASQDLLAQTGQRVRHVMADLRPPALDDYGVLAALDWYGSKYMASTGTAVTVAGREPDPRLDRPVELVLFRIAQEALTNVLKHAQAKHVIIHLDPDAAGKVHLVVADDGAGFVPDSQAGLPNQVRLGLIGMMERAQSVGAQCRVESKPGQGTRVIVEVDR